MLRTLNFNSRFTPNSPLFETLKAFYSLKAVYLTTTYNEFN